MSEGSEAGKTMGAEWKERTPMKRFADPSEIAKILVFFASDLASYCTGSELYADGGYILP